MRTELLKMKNEQKERAQEIRSLKSTRKEVADGYVPTLEGKSHEYRINHIAYCLLRGKEPEQIESHWNKDEMRLSDKEHAWKNARRVVDDVLKKWEEEDEAIRTGA